jgi:hypothetical protein
MAHGVDLKGAMTFSGCSDFLAGVELGGGILDVCEMQLYGTIDHLASCCDGGR